MDDAVDDLKDGRLAADAEQGAGRHLQHVACFVDHDARFDAEAVAQRAPLLRRLDQSTITFTRCSSTPRVEILVKPDGSTTRTCPSAAARRPNAPAAPGRRVNLHRVARQHVDLHFQVGRVAQLHQRRAGRHDGGAFLQHAQHAAVDRRIDRKVPAAVAVGGMFADRSRAESSLAPLPASGVAVDCRRLAAASASAPPRPVAARSGRFPRRFALSAAPRSAGGR